MQAIEERVTNIEEAFAQFMAQTARILAAIREEVSEIRASNARTDRILIEMQQQAEKERRQRVLELDEFRQQAEKDRQQADKDRQQAEKGRRDFNRRLAQVTDAQGLMIENMVWPNLNRIASQVFGGVPPLFSAIRLKRRRPENRGVTMEIDLLASTGTDVLICEAKSQVSAEKVREFLDRLKVLPEFFPEYAGHRLHPMFASIAIDESVVSFMTSQGVLALGFGGETMDLLNPDLCLPSETPQDRSQGSAFFQQVPGGLH